MGAKKESEETIKRKTELFNKYVMPYKKMIYKLVINYSMQKQYIDDNYNQCLYNYFHFIETYNPSMDIKAWIHIICKRFIKNLENKRSKGLQFSDDMFIENASELAYDPYRMSENVIGADNWRELFNDDELKAINSMKPMYIEAFILQLMGYSLKEIAEISYRNGNLKTKNIDTIKSRLFLAKKHLKNHLTRDGEYIKGN